MNARRIENKRQIVEDWLDEICSACESLASMEDEYHPGEYDAEIDQMLADAEGLVTLVNYEPSSDEWEDFEPEGYLWSTPTNIQVERLYPKALLWFAEINQDDN